MEYLSILMDKYIKKDVRGLNEEEKNDYLKVQKHVQDGFLSSLGPCVDECTMVSEEDFKMELRAFAQEHPQIADFVCLD